MLQEANTWKNVRISHFGPTYQSRCKMSWNHGYLWMVVYRHCAM